MTAVQPDRLADSLQAKAFDDQLYRLIAETIPHMVWTARPDGVADYHNRRVSEYTGLDVSQLAGWGWKAMVHPEDWERCLAAWTRAVQSGERYEVEYRLRRADGVYRWHHAAAVPLRSAAGEVLRWFGTSTDIEAEVRGAQILESMVEERTRALGESERRFQLFMDHLPAYAWIRDAQFRYTYVNRLYAKWWGLEPEAMCGHDASEFFSAELAEYFREKDQKVRRAGVPMQYVDSLPAGRWLKVKFPLPGSAGGIGVAGIALDISEQSRLEQALAESEQRFRSFMEHAPAAAWIKDARFRYTYVNRTYERVYGRAAKDVLGREDFDLHAPDLARFFREEDETILRTGEASQRPHKLPYADGRPGQWLVTKFPLGDSKGGTGVAGIAIDATARFEAEEKARRYADDVRDLVNRLVQAQESERRQVADDLHDLIGQNLTALGIDLQALKQHLQPAGDAIAAARLDAMAALLETTIDAIRGVMTDLRPVALEEFGLVPALRWYASEFGKRTGMKVSTNASGREPRLPADTELALFRIVQEALTNAAKHSGGSAVEIAVAAQDGGLRVSVEDDGRGFPEPAGARARRGGFGLPTMRERAEALRGTLRVEFPGRGTRVVVEIPAAPHAD